MQRIYYTANQKKTKSILKTICKLHNFYTQVWDRSCEVRLSLFFDILLKNCSIVKNSKLTEEVTFHILSCSLKLYKTLKSKYSNTIYTFTFKNINTSITYTFVLLSLNSRISKSTSYARSLTILSHLAYTK